MGNSQSDFTNDELEMYQELTFLTKKEILHVFERFKRIVPADVRDVRNIRLPKQQIMDLPELKVNPFRERICEVFSSSGDGKISFEDFLDLVSVFSETASRGVKIEYAFRIYDFNNDGLISSRDLFEIINLLTVTGEEKLNDEQIEQLIENILKEGDLDGDQMLSFAEFQHVMSKSPDFVNSFRIRL